MKKFLVLVGIVLLLTFSGCDMMMGTDGGSSGSDEVTVPEEPNSENDSERVAQDNGWDITQEDFDSFEFVETNDGYFIQTKSGTETWQSINGPQLDDPITFSSDWPMIAYEMDFAETPDRELDKIYFYLLDADGNKVLEFLFKPNVYDSNSDGIFEISMNGNKIGDDYIAPGKITDEDRIVGITISYFLGDLTIQISGIEGSGIINGFNVEEIADVEIIGYGYTFRGGDGHNPVKINPLILSMINL